MKRTEAKNRSQNDYAIYVPSHLYKYPWICPLSADLSAVRLYSGVAADDIIVTIPFNTCMSLGGQFTVQNQTMDGEPRAAHQRWRN